MWGSGSTKVCRAIKIGLRYLSYRRQILSVSIKLSQKLANLACSSFGSTDASLLFHEGFRCREFSWLSENTRAERSGYKVVDF